MPLSVMVKASAPCPCMVMHQSYGSVKRSASAGCECDWVCRGQAGGDFDTRQRGAARAGLPNITWRPALLQVPPPPLFAPPSMHTCCMLTLPAQLALLLLLLLLPHAVYARLKVMQQARMMLLCPWMKAGRRISTISCLSLPVDKQPPVLPPVLLVCA